MQYLVLFILLQMTYIQNVQWIITLYAKELFIIKKAAKISSLFYC